MSLLEGQTRKAAEIVEKLQEALDEVEDLSSFQVAWLEVTDRTLSLGIGDICLWDDQSNASEDLTFGFCLDEYLKEMENRALIFRQLQQKWRPGWDLIGVDDPVNDEGDKDAQDD